MSGVLAGKVQPATNRERLDFVEICRARQNYVGAVKLCTEAFAIDPRLAGDPKNAHRFNAACYAALAAAGQGKDADKLDEPERVRLRKQAVEWLRADLALWTNQTGSETMERELLQKALKRWQDDSDLASLRDDDTVAKLPADERDLCRKLWTDVAALLKRAASAK